MTLSKESRSVIETWSVDRVLNEEHFSRKNMQKMCTRN